MTERILTHSVNVKNPNTDRVATFEPGADLPRWAADILIAEDHVAYPAKDKRSEALVKAFQASKLAAEAAADLS